MVSPDSFEEVAAWATRQVPLGFNQVDDEILPPPETVLGPSSSSRPVPSAAAVPGSPSIPQASTAIGEGCSTHGRYVKRLRIDPGHTSAAGSHPLGFLEGEIHIPDSDRACFFRSPYDLMIHMLNVAKNADARWKSYTGHDPDDRVRAFRDHLISEHARIVAEIDEAGVSEADLESLISRRREELDTSLHERASWRKQEEELSARLSVVHLELEKTRAGVESGLAELEAARAGKVAVEDELRRRAGDVVDLAYEGYRKGLSHVRLVHDLPSADYHLFSFDHKIRDGSLVRYCQDRGGFDILHSGSQ